MADVGQPWPMLVKLARLWPASAKFGQIRPRVGQLWPASATIWPASAIFDRIRDDARFPSPALLLPGQLVTASRCRCGGNGLQLISGDFSEHVVGDPRRTLSIALRPFAEGLSLYTFRDVPRQDYAKTHEVLSSMSEAMGQMAQDQTQLVEILSKKLGPLNLVSQ